jgi:choline kinase
MDISRSDENMRGVILAAGIAARLRPLTDAAPKCLLPIGGETILGRMLHNLSEAGIGDVVIVTGYLAPQIEAFVAEKFPRLRVHFVHNPVYATTNNIYSLWLAKDRIVGGGMVLLDSDIIFDGKILDMLLRSGHGACLAVKTDIAFSEEEIKVTVDGRRRVLEIAKEVPIPRAWGESIGIEKFSPAIVESLFKVIERKILVENNVNQFYEAAFQEIIDRGGEIYALDIGSLLATEIDTLEDMREAERDVLPRLPRLGL